MIRTTSALLLAFLSLVAVAGCDLDSRESTRLVQSTFTGITKGDVSVADNIDWNSFQFEGTDYGSSYRTLVTDHEKAQFKQAVLMRISSLYKVRNWNPGMVRNWKVEAKGVESSVVVAELQGGSKISAFLMKVNFEKKIAKLDHL